MRARFMTKCTCTYIQAVQKVKFVMRWRCYNRYLWFEIERNLSPPDAFYGIFYTSKIRLRPGLRPGSRWGSLQRSPRPLAGGEGARCPLPKNPNPALGPSGLEVRPFGPLSSLAPNPKTQLRPCVPPSRQILATPLLHCFYRGSQESSKSSLR